MAKGGGSGCVIFVIPDYFRRIRKNSFARIHVEQLKRAKPIRWDVVRDRQQQSKTGFMQVLIDDG